MLFQSAVVLLLAPTTRSFVPVQQGVVLLPRTTAARAVPLLEDASLSVAAVQGSSMFVASVVGFGDALLAVPLLGFLGLDATKAAPLVSLVSVVAFASSLLADDKAKSVGKWDLSAALTTGAMLGIPCGVNALVNVDQHLITGALGAFLVLYGLSKLIGTPIGRPSEDDLLLRALPFGFLAGILGGTVSSPGPPAILFSQLCNWDPVTSRIMLFRFFLPVQILATFNFYNAGLLTESVLHQTALSAPAVLAAIAAGSKINSNLRTSLYADIVAAFLCAVGIVCLATAASS